MRHQTDAHAARGTDPSRTEPAARADGDEGRPPANRLLAVGSLAAVLLSAAGSVVAYGLLPGRMRVHWTLGMGPYYGPEFAPTWLVLAALTAAVAALAVGGYGVGVRYARGERVAGGRPTYTLAVLAALGLLLGLQALVVALNLG